MNLLTLTACELLEWDSIQLPHWPHNKPQDLTIIPYKHYSKVKILDRCSTWQGGIFPNNIYLVNTSVFLEIDFELKTLIFYLFYFQSNQADFYFKNRFSTKKIFIAYTIKVGSRLLVNMYCVCQQMFKLSRMMNNWYLYENSHC